MNILTFQQLCYRGQHAIQKGTNCVVKLNDKNKDEKHRRFPGMMETATKKKCLGVKKVFNDSVEIPTHMHGSETWTPLEGHNARIKRTGNELPRGMHVVLAGRVYWTNEGQEMCDVQQDALGKVT